MWNVLATGAAGVLFWQWRPELLGPEAPGYGLCAVDGGSTERVEAVSAFAAMLRRVPEAAATRPIPSRIGILVSRRSAVHAFATDRTMDIYRRSVMGAYRMLIDAGLLPELIHEDEVEAFGVPGHIACLYYPMPAVTSDTLETRLAAWVHDGGRLVSEAAPGEYDERGWHRATVPPESLRTVFGVASVETDAVAGDLYATCGTSSFRGAWMREQVALTSGRATGTFSDGATAVSENGYGAGQAVLIATCPSVAYDLHRDRETRGTIAALLATNTEPSLVRVATPSPGLMTRNHQLLDGRLATFVANWTPHTNAIEARSDAVVHTIQRSSNLKGGTETTIAPWQGALIVAADPDNGAV